MRINGSFVKWKKKMKKIDGYFVFISLEVIFGLYLEKYLIIY